MNTQNQNRPQDAKQTEEVKNQNLDTKSTTPEEVGNEDLKATKGGSAIGGQGLDLTNVLAGTLGTSQESSGSHNGNSYTSSDDRRTDFGLGQDSSNVSF